MADMQAIADALAGKVDDISGLRALGYFPDDIAVPFAACHPDPDVCTQYDSAMARGLDTHSFRVTVLVSSTSDRASQKAIAGYLNSSGATSVKEKVEVDVSLGGVIDSCRVMRAENYGQLVVAGVEYFGVEFVVEVLA